MSKDKANIAVLVSGGGTNLQQLLNAESNGNLHSGRITLVVSSSPSAYALKRAEALNVPAFSVSRSGCIDIADFESQLTSLLVEHNTDIIVLAGFLSILSADFVSQWPGRIINVHPALIPSFCGQGMYGLRVHEAALARGVKLSGATVHIVNEIPDGGPILMQKSVPVMSDDTPESLQLRVMEQAEWQILPAATEMLCAEYIKNKGGSNNDENQ